ATEAAGFAGEQWSSGASFVDYDRDGDLDLFVLHFATFDPALKCTASGATTEPEYCGPHTFPGVRDTLYRNNGDGTFEDVSESAGIEVPARGWGVICVDLTGDGWPDVYVANDEEPNQLWVNQQDGTFVDEALIRGAALNGVGRVEASMGVAQGDLNNDGQLEVFMTHISSETNTLLSLDAGGVDMYSDRSAASGMSVIDLQYTGWGCGFLDFDHDGDLDLAVANGRVARGPSDPAAQLSPFWNRYAEPNLLFENQGELRFGSVTRPDCAFTANPEVTRGLAFGDIDNDGDVDLVTVNVDNRVRVFRNDWEKSGRHWLGVRAIAGQRDALGAVVTVETDDGTLTRAVQPSYSYLASNDPRVHFGLGTVAAIKSIDVRWPDGTRERFAGPEVDQYVTLTQGEGEAVP
ncbi:MAG: CRTAC1 family protein, partial [Planctomycetales bacterium]|nr:CRTAC1 family protein [Planctomycetales bacterium]